MIDFSVGINFKFAWIALVVGATLLPFSLAVSQSPGFPNTNQIAGELLAGPLAANQGRTAVIAYHQGILITCPESPGSAPGSDLLSRSWNITDPRNPIGTVIPNMGPNTGIAAHGYWQEGIYLRAFNSGNGQDFTVVDSDSNGVMEVVRTGTNPYQFYYPVNPPHDFGWPNRGLLFQPFVTQMWWSYGATDMLSYLYKGTQLLAVWDHISLTGVIGHPVLIGNILYYASDQSNTGIAAYDITPSLNNPGTPPQLISVLKASVGGYWPEIWGGDGKLFFVFPSRENGRIYVADVTDPANMQVVADRQLPNGGDPSYVQYQDHYAFTDRYKINMRNNFSVDLVLDADGEGIDVSQFALPIGNLLATGGYPHPPTHSQGLAIWAHDSDPDTNPPYVGYHIPQNGQTNYPVSAPISLLIHETLRSETIISGSTFLLREVLSGGSRGPNIPGRLTFAFNDTLTFTPNTPLTADRTYEVLLTEGGIEDAVGNGIEQYSFTFSTGNSISGGNAAPVINSFTVSAYPATANTNLTFNFSATDSNTPLEYKVNFGDASSDSLWQTETSINHSYQVNGHYDAILSVRDSLGTVSSRRLRVTVSNSAPANLPEHNSTTVYDSDNSYIWAVNSDNDSVSRIDSSDFVEEIDLGSGCRPKNVSLDDLNNAWVTCSGTDSIRIIDINLDIQTINLDYGSAPFGIVKAPGSNFMLVSLYGKGQLIKINSTNFAIISSLNLGPTPRAIAITANSARALVTRFISPDSSGIVWDINPANMTLTRTISIREESTISDTPSQGRGLPNYLTAIAIRPDGARAWIASKSDNIRRGLYNSGSDLNQENSVRAIISEIDLTTNTEITAARRDIDNSDSPSSINFSPLGDYAFVTLQGNNVVAVYDTFILAEEEQSIVPTFARLASGRAPQGAVFANNIFYVNNFLSRSINRMDLSDFLTGQSASGNTTEIISSTNEKLHPTVLHGKRIFYNASDNAGAFGRNRMSGEGYISCATCHIDGSHDGRTWDFTGRGEGLRNTTDLRGRRGTGHGFIHWSGNFDEVQDFENDIRNAFGGDGFMSDDDFVLSSNTLGQQKAGFSPDLDALAAYVSSLDANNLPRSPYRNANGSKTASALNGASIFTANHCSDCHGGDSFTESNLIALNLRNVGSINATSGLRLGNTLTGIDTPTLLSIFDTAPYFHNGEASNLESVFNQAGGQIYQAEDTTRSPGTIIMTADWGGNFHESYVVGFSNAGDNIAINNINAGNGGTATISIRYSALYSTRQADITVNGQTTRYNFLQTVNSPSWYPSGFGNFTFTANLAAGTSNSISITPVFSFGQAALFIDEIKITTTLHNDNASAHRVINSLSVNDRNDLIQYLLQLDGSDDLSGPAPDPSPIPTPIPSPTPNPTSIPNPSPQPSETPDPSSSPTEDLCPNDPNKIVAGACGCGIAENDLNSNGEVDCLEVPAKPGILKLKSGKFKISMAPGFINYRLEIRKKSNFKILSKVSDKNFLRLRLRADRYRFRYRGCDSNSNCTLHSVPTRLNVQS